MFFGRFDKLSGWFSTGTPLSNAWNALLISSAKPISCRKVKISYLFRIFIYQFYIWYIFKLCNRCNDMLQLSDIGFCLSRFNSASILYRPLQSYHYGRKRRWGPFEVMESLFLVSPSHSAYLRRPPKFYMLNCLSNNFQTCPIFAHGFVSPPH